MNIPAEIGHPVRICSLAHVWEHLPDVIGFGKEQLFELHANHVVLAEGEPVIACVVVHHHDGPIAGTIVSLSEWLDLPTPSELFEIPDTAAALEDPAWTPRAFEPSLKTVTAKATSSQLREVIRLVHWWGTGRPITRTVNLLDDIARTTSCRELIVEASQTMGVVVRAAARRSVRRADRAQIIEGLQRIARLCKVQEENDD